MIEDTNKQYYDTLYSGHGPWRFRLHGRVSFDQQAKARPNLALALPAIQSLLSAQRHIRVLDYGCGWGAFLFRLPRRHVELFGFDISTAGLIGLARAMQAAGRRFSLAQVSDDAALVIRPDKMDFVLCSHVLEHVPDDARLLTAVSDTLRPGGYLLVNVPINETEPDPRHARRYDEPSLAARMKAAGFTILVTRQEGQLDGLLGTGPAAPRWKRVAVRLLRALAALTPHGGIRWIEQRFLSNRAPRQLLMLGAKTDA